MTARAIRNYGHVLADFVMVASLSPEELLRSVEIEHRHHADLALAAGRGCIMAVPHMGSWDVAGSYAAVLGYRVAAVAERFPASLDAAVVGAREKFGLRIIPLGRSAVRTVLSALAENSVVALLCDLPHGPGVEVDFFGRRATVPSGPAALACRAGCPLLPAYVRATGPGRYRIHLDRPIPTEGRCGGKDAAARLMQEVVQRFEVFIRDHPDQWFAFRPVFR